MSRVLCNGRRQYEEHPNTKALGVKTVLITAKTASGRILSEDKPEVPDPAVDCSMQTIEVFAKILPGLWGTQGMFEPKLPN